MADNVAFTPGTGATGATDDIGGVHYPRVKLSLGADGTANDASAGAGAVGTGTQRVTLASDDPAVVALQILDNAIAGSEMQVDVITMPTITVNSHAVTNAGTFAVQNTAATPAGTNNIGDVDVLTINGVAPAFGSGAVGATVQRVALATDSPGVITTGTAGTASAVVLSVQGVASMTPILATAAGGVAHDAANSGNPIKVGARARSSEISAVANDDISDLLTDLVGKLIVLPYANPENFVSGAITSAMTGTTSTSLIAAPASGLRNYITQITVSNAHATVGTDVIIQDGSGGTTLYTIPAAAVYGGAVITFPTPLRQPTTATAIYCANVTTGASTKVSASGYKGA